ncbi:N-acetyltransferase [Hyunsoonleella pacifica]|nr:N-acetyltransferase [Hyunsoonleella pacifica]
MFSLKLKYITIEDPLYQKAVAIRKEQFFKNMKNSSDLINDALESDGLHLVCLNENEVVGTGRLNIEDNTGIISQMAVNTNFQKQGIGAKILKALIEYSEEKGVTKIVLSARETALGFYSKFNFKPVGELYPSLKTGIIHQKMELKA